VCVCVCVCGWVGVRRVVCSMCFGVCCVFVCVGGYGCVCMYVCGSVLCMF